MNEQGGAQRGVASNGRRPCRVRERTKKKAPGGDEEWKGKLAAPRERASAVDLPDRPPGMATQLPERARSVPVRQASPASATGTNDRGRIGRRSNVLTI